MTKLFSNSAEELKYAVRLNAQMIGEIEETSQQDIDMGMEGGHKR